MLRSQAAIGLCALLAAGSAAAADRAPANGSPLVGELGRCRSISDNAQRLACFDRASGALLAAASRGDVSVVDRSELRTTRRSLFGFGLPKLPFFRGDPTADEASETLDSKIASARELGNGKYRIGLTDGNAVWDTLETYEALDPPRSGQPVTIKRGALGSYLVRIDGQRGVKAKRVQ
jgi:hypothetical protein